MARSSILLKNLTALVVGNLLGGNNLLIFGTINITIHLTDLPGTSLLAVTPNHNLSTCFLGEPWVQTGPLRVVDNIGGAWDGAQLTIHLKNIFFFCHFSAVQLSVRLWALAYATWFLSCLLFSAGFWAAIRPWRTLQARLRHTVLDKTGVAGVHSSWICEVVDMGLAFDGWTWNCHLEQLSCAVCPNWVCHGCRHCLGSACESSPPAV